MSNLFFAEPLLREKERQTNKPQQIKPSKQLFVYKIPWQYVRRIVCRRLSA